jgi:lipid II:glycine glycyltransferase (peptidoglycan interpeptide bridge formation enzyme)
VRSLEIIGNIYSSRRGAIVKNGKEEELANWFVQYLLYDYRSEWDLIDFCDLSPQDRFISAILEKLNKLRICTVRQDLYANIVTDLSNFSSAEEFYSVLSKNWRRNIVKSINKHVRGGEFSIWLLQDSSQDVKSAVSSYYKIYSESWKKNEADPEFHGKLAFSLSNKQKVRIFFLCYRSNSEKEKDNYSLKKPNDHRSNYIIAAKAPDQIDAIAALYCIIHAKRVYLLKVCHNESYANLSPGTLLWWYAIKYLIDNEKCFQLDFQKGDQPYKYNWNGKIKEIRFRVISSNPHSICTRIDLLVKTYQKKLCNIANKIVKI